MEAFSTSLQALAYDALCSPERLAIEVPGISDCFPNGGHLLDLGCGTAAHAAALMAHRGDLLITGIDASYSMVDHGRDREVPGFQVRLGDACKPPEGPFDGAYCVGNVLPLLCPEPGLEALFARWADVLAAGASLVIQCQDPDQLAATDTLVRTLSAADGQTLTLHKSREQAGDGWHLHLKVTDGEGRSEDSASFLHRLCRGAIETALQNAGFRCIFSRKSFDSARDGSDIVIHAVLQ